MQAILNIAIREARKAGGFLLRERDRLDTPCKLESLQFLQEKAEAIIIEEIEKTFPTHGVVCSSTTIERENMDALWSIEICGLQNFINNIPHYAIAIAIEEQGKVKYTLIYDPNTEQYFTACQGRGAECDSYKLRGSKKTKLSGSIISTSSLQAKQLGSTAILSALNEDDVTIYNHGCDALSLAYVAAGRVHGFYGADVSETVCKAAGLLLQESAILVSDLKGGHNGIKHGDLVCANSKLFKLLLPKVRESYEHSQDS